MINHFAFSQAWQTDTQTTLHMIAHPRQGIRVNVSRFPSEGDGIRVRSFGLQTNDHPVTFRLVPRHRMAIREAMVDHGRDRVGDLQQV
jgi:hypothetical protein